MLDILYEKFVVAGATTTVLQDWRKGRRSEAEDINGLVVDRGREARHTHARQRRDRRTGRGDRGRAQAPHPRERRPAAQPGPTDRRRRERHQTGALARRSAEGGPEARRGATTKPGRPDGGAQQARDRWIASIHRSSPSRASPDGCGGKARCRRRAGGPSTATTPPTRPDGDAQQVKDRWIQAQVTLTARSTLMFCAETPWLSSRKRVAPTTLRTSWPSHRRVCAP